jgi:hypothetical protein
MTITVPSDPNERQKLKQMLAEMTHCLQRADGEKDQMKEICEEAYSTFNIAKKTINKLARTMYKHSYADLQAENEDFEFLYEALVLGKNVVEE